MKKILFALVALLLVAAFAGTLYFLYEKSQVPPVVYSTNTPFVTSIVKKTVATGSIVPRNEIDIKPQVSGILAEIYVEPGQEVARGDLIAKVTIIPNMIALSNGENRLNRARINLENADNEFARNRQLFEEGVLSEVSFRVFELDLKRAREEVEASEDSLAVIREGARKKSGIRTNTLVKATVSGMILDVPVEVGDSVIESNTFNDGTTIASVADMEEMIFEGRVDESEVGKLEEGMVLLLTIGAIDSEQFEAKLEFIAPKGMEENGAIQFEIRAAMNLKEGFFIRANYSANADIVLASKSDVLAIQEAWLQFDGDQAYVDVEIGEQDFERRDIETGLSDGLNIQIVSGLSLEDRIKDSNGASA